MRALQLDLLQTLHHQQVRLGSVSGQKLSNSLQSCCMPFEAHPMAYAPSPACSEQSERASSLSRTGPGWGMPAMMPTLEMKPMAFLRLVSARRITCHKHKQLNRARSLG